MKKLSGVILQATFVGVVCFVPAAAAIQPPAVAVVAGRGSMEVDKAASENTTVDTHAGLSAVQHATTARSELSVYGRVVALGAVMVALHFMILILNKKLRATTPVIPPVPSYEQQKPPTAEPTDETGEKKGATAPEMPPAPTVETSPPAVRTPQPIPEAPPPIPGGLLGEAVTRLLLLREDYFFWQQKEESDPNPDVSLPDRFRPKLLSEGTGPFEVTYPKGLQNLVQDCKQQLLELKTKGGDAVSVADQVIARFRAEADKHKSEHAIWIRQRFEGALEKLKELGRMFREERSLERKQEEVRDLLDKSIHLENKALELLAGRFYQQLYVYSQLSIERKEFADIVFKEFKALGEQHCADIEKDEDSQLGALLKSYYLSLMDEIEKFESAAILNRDRARRGILEATKSLRMLTVDIRKTVVSETT